MRVETFPREEFLAERWSYRAGQHVTLLGPTDCGKTTLGYQLLQQTTSERLPGVVLVMKPHVGPDGKGTGDRTVAQMSRRLRYRTVRRWPPRPSVWSPRRPPGWVLWPRHVFDPDVDDPRLYQEFRAGLLDSYRRGSRVVFADEVYGLAAELNLRRELAALWTRGRSMGTGLWSASQRPALIPLWAYSQAQHLFIWHDPDRRARQRYGEIGGVDPRVVEQVAMSLGEHQALYIRRAGRRMCVVDA